MRYDGIVFDFNGVLLWDGHQQEAAWQEVADRLRGRPLDGEELELHVHGRANRHTLEYLAGRELPEGEASRLSDEKEEAYRRPCLAQGPAFALSPGAVELLYLLAQLGIGRTIATASPAGNVAFFVEHLRLEQWFEPSQIVFDVGCLTY